MKTAGRVYVSLLLAGALGSVWPVNGAASQVGQNEAPAAAPCDSAEACFLAAAQPKERLGNQLTKDQISALKLERLRLVMERFPGSLWAKRAGLLSGVLLIDRNPAAAMAFFRAAQRDFPVLDDYVRFWMGDASLRLSDAKEAAALFESISQAVPDSNLLDQAALRAGEAWYQAGDCAHAVHWLAKGIVRNDKDPLMAQSWMRAAGCYLRERQFDDAQAALMQVWVRFAATPEAKEAETLLRSNLTGTVWAPTAEERYQRAQALQGQAWHAEAIEELQRIVAMEPASAHRGGAKLKVGVAQVRLKQYDQARETFRALMADRVAESDEAAVWLARVYLRQAMGPKLLELSRTVEKQPLSSEQKGQIHVFAGVWLEDQGQYEEAIAKYRQVSKMGEPATQRAEALWRMGWVYYRTARYKEALDVWQRIVDQHDPDFEPQALYWIGRSLGQLKQARAREVLAQVLRQFPHTYYGQLAKERLVEFPVSGEESGSGSVNGAVEAVNGNGGNGHGVSGGALLGAEVEQQASYRRAVELRTLGLDTDAARELAALTDQYSRQAPILMALAVRLNEVGAYHHALRLARAQFRDKLERTGGMVAPELWTVGYPTGLIPTITLQELPGVNPYLVAAIIREESQYDPKAVSRVGAIGLMQVMPATATAVASQHRFPAVTRDDLFDQDTNIRIGARYVQQLLAQFSGNVIQTIAAYNAGPIAVEGWAAQYRGRSPDEFVELIPYRETRQYVKRVLRSFREYVRLAGSS